MDMGRGEERVRCMERVTRKFNITVCKIDSKQEFVVWLRKLKLKGNLLYDSGNSISTQKGGMGRKEMGGSFKREGIYVYLWLIHVEV